MINVEYAKMTDIGFSLQDTIKITFEIKKSYLEQFTSLDKGISYDIDIKKHKEKRSLSQNAYMWVLIRSISERIGLSADEVYKMQIKQNGKYVVLALKKHLIPDFERTWNSNGLGNFVIKYQDKEDTSILLAYYGSHTYRSDEMSKLIDGVIEDCRELGIPTMTKEEIMRLKNENDGM